MKKENEKEIMKRIKEAGDPDNYETSWDDKGIPVSKKKSNIKRGGLSRAQGARFELQVRKDLENKGRIVDKWSNNIDLDNDKLVPAKRKYNPFKKMLIVGVGFPDFISLKQIHEGAYSVIGVEVKINGLLSREEKEKCAWYLKNGIFSAIWIAKKGTPNQVPSRSVEGPGKGVPPGGASTSSRSQDIFKKMSTRGIKRGQIEYIDFKEKWGGKF